MKHLSTNFQDLTGEYPNSKPTPHFPNPETP